jgi:hypothetical protein
MWVCKTHFKELQFDILQKKSIKLERERERESVCVRDEVIFPSIFPLSSKG